MKTSCTCLYCYQSYNHKPNCSGDRGVFRRTLVLPSVHINFITRERERERERERALNPLCIQTFSDVWRYSMHACVMKGLLVECDDLKHICGQRWVWETVVAGSVAHFPVDLIKSYPSHHVLIVLLEESIKLIKTDSSCVVCGILLIKFCKA